MAFIADTGNQATITFAEGIVAPLKVRRIMQPEESLGKIDASTLASQVYREFIPEDLTDAPEITVEFNWDSSQAAPVLGTYLGLVTITYPEHPVVGESATRTGTGYVSGIKHPDLANNEIQTGTLKIQFDHGDTNLTYTPATA